MVQYGFDGVDFDWEYPDAPDRGGNAVDVDNYPKLLQGIWYRFDLGRKPCGFSGLGEAGPCTNTAGILLYREIEDILSQNEDKYDFYRDTEAAVNFIIYDGVNWVSYDDTVTF